MDIIGQKDKNNMISEIEKEIKDLKAKRADLNNKIKETKNSLQEVNDKINELENKKELIANEENLNTEVTVEYLWDKFNNLDFNKNFKDYDCLFHVTPLKQIDLEFYKDKIHIRDLKYRYCIHISGNKTANGIELWSVNLNSMNGNNLYCYNHQIISQEQYKKNIDLDKVFEKYVQLRNEYLKDETKHINNLIPIKIYVEDKLKYADIGHYLNVIRNKGDYGVLNSFAREFNIDTGGYYMSLNKLNKEQLHEIAQTIRDNKEQLFRWSLSSKWKNQMNAKVEFGMTPIFKIFKKHNVYIATPAGCVGNGKH